jgi:hypothetical protein
MSVTLDPSTEGLAEFLERFVDTREYSLARDGPWYSLRPVDSRP